MRIAILLYDRMTALDAIGPYEVLAPRAWAMRPNLTVYDAAYVALAEMTDATLVTLDRRIGGAPGVRCRVVTPGS